MVATTVFKIFDRPNPESAVITGFLPVVKGEIRAQLINSGQGYAPGQGVAK
jgi:hypothetical protein